MCLLLLCNCKPGSVISTVFSTYLVHQIKTLFQFAIFVHINRCHNPGQNIQTSISCCSEWIISWWTQRGFGWCWLQAWNYPWRAGCHWGQRPLISSLLTFVFVIDIEQWRDEKGGRRVAQMATALTQGHNLNTHFSLIKLCPFLQWIEI